MWHDFTSGLDTQTAKSNLLWLDLQGCRINISKPCWVRFVHLAILGNLNPKGDFSERSMLMATAENGRMLSDGLYCS